MAARLTSVAGPKLHGISVSEGFARGGSGKDYCLGIDQARAGTSQEVLNNHICLSLEVLFARGPCNERLHAAKSSSLFADYLLPWPYSILEKSKMF